MSVVGIDHVQMAIPPGSEGRCRAFYVDVIGFTEVEKPKALKARGGLWLAGGAHQLHLGVEKDFRPARKAHPAFAVDDVRALAARMEAAGCEVTWSDDIPGDSDSTRSIHWATDWNSSIAG